MKKIFYLLIVICASIVVCKAETIEKVGEIDAGFAVLDSVEDSDGNYYLSGANAFTSEGRVAKYNANYELIVEKTFTEYGQCSSVDIDLDGNIYVGCDSKEVFVGHGITQYIKYNIYNNRVIIKLDSNFNVVFEKNLSEEFDISQIVELKVYDGYLYAIGGYFKFGDFIETVDGYNNYSYDYDYFLLKMDLNGNIVYDKKINNETQYFSRSFHNGTGTVYGSGTMVWKSSNILFKGNDIYIGTEFNYGMLLSKFKTNGDKVWTKEFGLDGDNYINDIQFSNNDTMIAVGSIYSRDIPEIQFNSTKVDIPIIMEFDLDGNVLRNKVLDARGYFPNVSVVENGYYVTLVSFDNDIPGLEENNTRNYVIKYDNDFNIKDEYDLLKVHFGNISSKGVEVYDDTKLLILNETKSNYYEEEISLRIDETKSIEGLFDDLANTTVDWKIEDNSILKLEGDTIVPLKVGTTNIKTIVGRTDYVIKVTVEAIPEPEQPEEEPPVEGPKEDITEEKETTKEPKPVDNKKDEQKAAKPENDNPNTASGIFVFGTTFILVLSLFVGIILRKKCKKLL